MPLHNPELMMDSGAGGQLSLCCYRHGLCLQLMPHPPVPPLLPPAAVAAL